VAVDDDPDAAGLEGGAGLPRGEELLEHREELLRGGSHALSR